MTRQAQHFGECIRLFQAALWTASGERTLADHAFWVSGLPFVVLHAACITSPRPDRQPSRAKIGRWQRETQGDPSVDVEGALGGV